MLLRNVALTLALVSLAACENRAQAPTTVLPEPPRGGGVGYLSVSEINPPVGVNVTITGRVTNASGLPRVGSFVAELRYEPGGLSFVSEVPLLGGLRAINPQSGVVYTAGASADGFPDDRLFAVVMRVDNPAALRTLALRVTELNGADLVSQLSGLRVSASLVAATPSGR